MYTFSFEVITNIKIVSLKDQILHLIQLEDGDISRLTSLYPSSHLQSLLMRMQIFYPEVESFTKNGYKFGWVKYWWMTFNLPNLPKFSPPQLCYMVFEKNEDIHKKRDSNPWPYTDSCSQSQCVRWPLTYQSSLWSPFSFKHFNLSFFRIKCMLFMCV